MYTVKEREIILRVKSGDSSAFTALYNLYWGKVYNFTQLYIISKEDAEEIVQEVFTKIWENREKLSEVKSFDGFLFILTRNTIFNHSRDNFNRHFYKITISDAYNLKGDDLVEDIIASDIAEHINKLIEQLPPRQKEVYRLSRVEHLTYKEIAQQLSIEPKTVERHINEAIKHLRKHLPASLLIIAMKKHMLIMYLSDSYL